MCAKVPMRDSTERKLFMDHFRYKKKKEKVLKGIFLFLSCLTFTPKIDIPYTIMLLKTDEFTCCKRQDTKTRHMSSNAVFSWNVYCSLVFVFANNCLTSVALWRKKGFVKVPVLHSSTYYFKPGKHSPGKTQGD